MFEFKATTRISEADQALADRLNLLIQDVAALEGRTLLAGDPIEYDGRIKVATVRMPAKLYDALAEEAHVRHTSLNKLAIAKLACFLPPTVNVPTDARDLVETRPTLTA